MTSIQQANPWTPELIQMDKELKAKYGQNAHIIPAKIDMPKMIANNYDTDLLLLSTQDNADLPVNVENKSLWDKYCEWFYGGTKEDYMARKKSEIREFMIKHNNVENYANPVFKVFAPLNYEVAHEILSERAELQKTAA